VRLGQSNSVENDPKIKKQKIKSNSVLFDDEDYDAEASMCNEKGDSLSAEGKCVIILLLSITINMPLIL
jgi:hypothetical protein